MISNSQSEDAHAANGMIMNNNVAYRAKQAGGTVKDVMKLGTDDILRLSQLRSKSHTTDSTQENIMIQSGWGFDQGEGDNNMEKTITFPTAYDTILSVHVSPLGIKSGSDPTAIGDFDLGLAGTTYVPHLYDITTTTFVVRITDSGGGNIATVSRVGFTWISFGIKA